ncbi:N-acetylmuramoyl-L-alanine amidase [Plasticicumulans acidivorans]|uniref:N-acetylmuramoyl-L-alanine amidase AmiC n=1 Tax=Plasticicumulans acidivorans TaxID=886464 RepID=A0A317MYF5_9GAMM|nr:N-acetylmuramoyl-L-alanine amidase [Plasticicumulans acidivorans]PWV63332.1 N-acetylmuramoyl-L-alanine amidase [Plasticicumulans acidivorans]
MQRTFIRLFAALVLCCGTVVVLAAGSELRGARVVEGADRSQLILDLSAPARYSTYYVDQPPRVVVDLPQTTAAAAVRDLQVRQQGSPVINSVRGGARKGGGLRIQIDLKTAAQAQSFLVPGGNRQGNRLVIEISHGAAGQTKAAPLPDINLVSDAGQAAPKPVRPASKKLTRAVRREVVVIVDPGHGGKDTGAIGGNGVLEKDVVLAIGRKLAALINREPGMRAVMTRRSDVFLPLRERIRLARKYKADLFISVHADSAPGGGGSGASVYALSTKGASSEAARWLADRENAADLVAGLHLSDKDPQLASVLLDLSQEATLESSLFLANKVLGSLKQAGPVHYSNVERAGFVVLKSPDIPSILVETAFLSNPDEETKLSDGNHQQHLAQAVMDGVRGYFRQRLPHSVMVADSGAEAEAPAPATPPRSARRRDADDARRPAAQPAIQPVAMVDPIELHSRTSARETRATRSSAKPTPAVERGSTARKPQRYVVQRGESLQQIAAKLGTPLGRLLAANQLPSNQLRVPAGTPLVIPQG